MERKESHMGAPFADGRGRDAGTSDSEGMSGGAGLLQLEGGSGLAVDGRFRGDDAVLAALGWIGEFTNVCDPAGADREGRTIEDPGTA